MLVSAGIVLSLIFEAVQFVTSIDVPQLLADGWFPRRCMFSIPTVLVGSLIVTLIAMLVAAPVGLATATYLAEYATPRLRKTVKPILEILAGIPSVVLGFFALTFIDPVIVRGLFSEAKASTLLAAGIGEAKQDYIYKGYRICAFPDAIDAKTPELGYMPGPMPWFLGERLRELGIEIVNSDIDGQTCRDRKLLTGDSPFASNSLGKLAAKALLDEVGGT